MARQVGKYEERPWWREVEEQGHRMDGRGDAIGDSEWYERGARAEWGRIMIRGRREGRDSDGVGEGTGGRRKRGCDKNGRGWMEHGGVKRRGTEQEGFGEIGNTTAARERGIGRYRKEGVQNERERGRSSTNKREGGRGREVGGHRRMVETAGLPRVGDFLYSQRCR